MRSSIFAAPYETEPAPVWSRVRTGAFPEGMILRGATNDDEVEFSPAPQRLWIDRKSQTFWAGGGGRGGPRACAAVFAEC